MQGQGLYTTKDLPTDFASSFASVMAALKAAKPEDEAKVAPRKKERKAKHEEPVWHDDALADDVVALSYEKALKAHARYRPTDVKATDKAAKKTEKTVRAKSRTQKRAATVPDESRKSASVTVRMSREEWKQLQARATEAKMTVSAYMRSCTLEVETLRAQVKETLAELKQARLAEPVPEPKKKPVEREMAGGWRARLFPRWAQNRAAEA